jgi:hypothetical protein
MAQSPALSFSALITHALDDRLDPYLLWVVSLVYNSIREYHAANCVLVSFDTHRDIYKVAQVPFQQLSAGRTRSLILHLSQSQFPKMLSSLLAGVFVAAALASPIAPSFVAHERRHEPPRGWLKPEKVPTGSILPMRIGLVQSNLEKGHDLLMDV